MKTYVSIRSTLFVTVTLCNMSEPSSSSASTLSKVVHWWQSHLPSAPSSSSQSATAAMIQPRPSPLGGNGLFLTTTSLALALATAQPIATIPNDLLITAAKIHHHAQQHDRPLARALDHLTPPDCQLAPSRLAILTFLLRFRALPDQSQPNPWRPYLLALPTLADLHVPTQYEDQELALLHGTAMPRLVAAKRAKLVDELESILSAFDQVPTSPTSESAPSVNVDMRQAVSLADLLWADAIFWSRVLETPAPTSSTSGPQSKSAAATFELAMIPILDFANHSFDNPTLRWDRDPATGDVHLSLTSSSPSTTLTASDELFLCYDPEKSNEQLLFTHGFVIPGNTRGYISVDAMPELNMLAAQAPELSHRIQWAVNHLQVRPMVQVSANPSCKSGPAQSAAAATITWLESLLDPTSLALVLLVAVDDAGAAHAIQVASESTATDQQDLVHKTLAVLKAKVGASQDAVERACEFLHVVFSRVAQEVDEIKVGTVVSAEQDMVVVDIEGVGEDGDKAVVQHEMARARLDAIVGYKEQVREVVLGVVKATMVGGQ
ncbi:hypothetical protein BCR44DRAFT_1436564 [Catenaria anguillulae PL171]|uniref:SET domain-containing protein n=1 Tax=Catenaria anguillulae PL171 TaxID=765915 RepID=A0A1Y2HII9_9FUNG|nr:hypothetical protein BCR44DRAFT_1436564 [Catenaria anguillulae PL171]